MYSLHLPSVSNLTKPNKIDFGNQIKLNMELFVSLIIKQIKYNRQREPFDFVFPPNKLLTEPKS